MYVINKAGYVKHEREYCSLRHTLGLRMGKLKIQETHWGSICIGMGMLNTRHIELNTTNKNHLQDGMNTKF